MHWIRSCLRAEGCCCWDILEKRRNTWRWTQKSWSTVCFSSATITWILTSSYLSAFARVGNNRCLCWNSYCNSASFTSRRRGTAVAALLHSEQRAARCQLWVWILTQESSKSALSSCCSDWDPGVAAVWAGCTRLPLTAVEELPLKLARWKQPVLKPVRRFLWNCFCQHGQELPPKTVLCLLSWIRLGLIG